MDEPSAKVSINDVDAHERIKSHLNDDGYVVVTDLYSAAECQSMINEFESLARKLRPEWIDDDDRLQFKHQDFLCSFKGGMGHIGPVHHQQYVWDIRQDERIVGAFAAVYNVEPTELYVSMDSLCIREPNTVAADDAAMREWYHTDQTYSYDFACIQGMVTLRDMPKDESPLRVWPGAHRKELLKHLTKEGNTTNYRHIDKSDEAKLDQHFPDLRKRFKVDAPQGSIVLWDSRLPHMGGRSQKETIGRHVVYVSYQPKALLGEWSQFDTPQEGRDWCLEARVIAFEELLRTTHWAASIIRVQQKPGPHYMDTMNQAEHRFVHHPEEFMSRPTLTALGESLVGLADWKARQRDKQSLTGQWQAWIQEWILWAGLARWLGW
eukprot:TRINITY_DN12533_c0_g2_i2.p1 TRINITY_DN12533_c0_g2~~TRINITY_DN12533_c0_g2_i2.p1  ORF type:complete len:379 (+),score=65.46 TRINITY_DN12533_c0_g2_i2:75-1211(+)